MMNKTPPQFEPDLDFARLRRREKEEVDRWFDCFADPVYAFIFHRVGRDNDLAGDVAGVIRGEQITHSESDIPDTVRITIELEPETAHRLHACADAKPEKLFVVDFNGELNVVPMLDTAHPDRVSFDLSLLGISLAELEEHYFTTTDERNKS